MRSLHKNAWLTVAGIALILGLGACARAVGIFPTAHAEPPVAEEQPAGAAEVPSDVSSLPYLDFHRFAPLQGMDSMESAAAVHVLTRSDDLTAYPCANCHVKPLEELQAESNAEGQLAHWDVTLNHADTGTMTCTTCHNVDDNVDQLHTLTGQPIDFDASYGVCAQCHASEFEEWLGGAHGKRVGGWAEPRVIQSCTDCHDPHDPAWDVRWPAVPPQQREKSE